VSYRLSILSASLVSLGAGVVLLAACSGKVLSLGTNTPSQTVSPSEVSGTVTACAANAAHPNVCCTAGPGQEASCLTYPDTPFAQCASGSTTYPDPRSCCPLDGSGPCTAMEEDGAAGSPGFTSGASGSGSSGAGVATSGGVAGGSGCTYACPPGWYVPPNPSEGECCFTDGSGTGCSGGGSSSGVTGVCPACPSGWQAPQGAPDLCCTTEADGIIECFSQASTPPPTPTYVVDASAPLDVMAPVAVGCGGRGPDPDGAVYPCSCNETYSGHSYTVSCDPNTSLCSCIVDNNAASSTFPDTGNMCADYSVLFTSCGFPQ
jgi:hypothetical protein